MARLDPTGVSRILSYIKNWVTAALGGKANSSHTHSNYVPRSGGGGELSIFSSSKEYPWTHGAYLSLFSEDYTANSQWTNGFRLASNNSSTSDSYVLRGDSSGNLSWNGVAISLNGHTHTKSQITDFPAYGNTAGTICQGNDSRLSDARTPYFANNTWYAVGDDAAIGDHNVGGGLGVKSLNNATTRIDFCQYNNAGNYKSITFDGTTLYMNGNCDYATSAGGVAWSNVTGKPTIPTKTSDLTNNSGFLTSHNPIDSSLSSTSTNAVQNKVVKSALDGKLAINTGSGIIERYGNGQYLYCQIATITITGGYVNFPIVLEISGRGMLFSTVQIVFSNTSSTDPTISKFISDNYNYFYIKKTATSTWAVYVKYTEYWGGVIVHRASGVGLANSSISCTFTASDLSELPSGCTQVSNDLTTNGYRIYVG